MYSPVFLCTSVLVLSVPQDEKLSHPHILDHGEVDKVDVPQLLCKSAVCPEAHVSDEYQPFIFAPAPKGHLNQVLKTHSPPSSAVPAVSTSPPSSFRAVFQNPSYNLPIITDYTAACSDSSPQPLRETCFESDTNGYLPQKEALAVAPIDGTRNEPMTCVLSYVLIPPAQVVHGGSSPESYSNIVC